MRSVWKARLELKPWVDPQACAECDKRFLREECDCDRVRDHLIKEGLLFHKSHKSQESHDTERAAGNHRVFA